MLENGINNKNNNYINNGSKINTMIRPYTSRQLTTKMFLIKQI